jgi:hypothetical protein
MMPRWEILHNFDERWTNHIAWLVPYLPYSLSRSGEIGAGVPSGDECW